LRSPSLNDVRKELQELPPKRLAELCVTLARYKKDNKEYLSYLLFDSHDKSRFVAEVKQQVNELFAELKGQSNLYYLKKSLRKILRIINRYCKYIADKGLAAELHIYFCQQIREEGIPFKKSQLLLNMYEQELKKINTLISSLHEDLQSDYRYDLEKISL
jgi:hypothetical protein